MDTCSVEILTLICEYACCDDFGRTARCLGLVSKHFRTIVEPIELRTFIITDMRQLQGALARLEQARASMALNTYRRTEVDVRHLFISDLMAEHTVEFRSYFNIRSPIRHNFSESEVGRVAWSVYREHSDRFWKSITTLIQQVSPSLRTLSLLISGTWPEKRRHSFTPLLQKGVLGVLSGISFPRLVSLTIKHSMPSEIKCFDATGSIFHRPSTPSLQRLHVISSISKFMDFSGQSESVRKHHPLLENLDSNCCRLTHLLVCDTGLWSAEEFITGIFGEQALSCPPRALPGSLQSVVLERATRPHYRYTAGQTSREIRKWQKINNDVQDYHIDGLEVHCPTPTYHGSVKSEHETLLDEWKEQVLAYPI